MPGRRAAVAPQVIQQRGHLTCNPFDLLVTLLMMADQINGELANPRRVEGPYAVRYLLR